MRKPNNKFVSLLAAGAVFTSLAFSAHAQETKLALGMSGWTGFAPLTLADKAGLFKKHGLDVDIKMIPQKDRHLALASNAIQCAATTVEIRAARPKQGHTQPKAVVPGKNCFARAGRKVAGMM